MSERKKMTNRELAAMYLARVKDEDEKKINAFIKAAFTEAMLAKLGGFSAQEFKEAGKLVSKDLDRYLSDARKKLDASKSKKEKSTEPVKKDTEKTDKQDSVKASVPQMQVSSHTPQANPQVTGAPQGQMTQKPNIGYGQMPQKAQTLRFD